MIRVLVVDDDADTLELLKAALRLNDFAVIAVSNAGEALNIALTQSFDCFLFDNWMPTLTGIELCRAVREFDSITPIVFCSGAARKADEEEAMKAGANCYLKKPVDVETLLATLRRCVRSH